MRSIFRDFSYDYFSILSYPKEDWHSHWRGYREKHPRVIEEYMLKNNLDEASLRRELESLPRRELDGLSQYWERAGVGEKTRILKELGKMSEELHLEREDFVIHILGGLGKQTHMIVPTSKGNVVMIDLYACWKGGRIAEFHSLVMNALADFLEYTKLSVRHGMGEAEKERRFSRLREYILEHLDGLNFHERLEKTVVLLDKYVEYFNWTGFYLAQESETLILGPFVGEPTEHVRIPFGAGICGQAAERKTFFVVPDVTKEHNYLACSAQTKSEIVIPLMKGETLIGELDIDSYFPNSFDDSDRTFLEKICQFLTGS